MLIKTETLPHTVMIDGLGLVHIYRNDRGRIAVDINGKIAWTFMVGLNEVLWLLNKDIQHWGYINTFKQEN